MVDNIEAQGADGGDSLRDRASALESGARRSSRAGRRHCHPERSEGSGLGCESQPMLYKVATAGLTPSDIASPIRSILRGAKNIEVVLAQVDAIDVERREVRFTDGAVVSYDYLLVATGARHSYFGHDEWEELAPG